ncbi:hypothetical protein THAOC_23112 [Thalassiosira oceanica]|uniref:Uncharacterized protein n=1 Tax=Thalassiosira oceanica TaxID=159749 RepID=K0S7L6_THAOC|nr:hypothetical protein THAOC_23112 [Thalassiosira oceanica]|eukprot:EJK56906.1 hypothetical protein THAOC_23112 [Thalassiosira oceanica]
MCAEVRSGQVRSGQVRSGPGPGSISTLLYLPTYCRALALALAGGPGGLACYYEGSLAPDQILEPCQTLKRTACMVQDGMLGVPHGLTGGRSR